MGLVDNLSFNICHLLTPIYFRLEKITQANRQLIETHHTVREQLTTFLTISQDIIQEMNKLKQQLTKDIARHVTLRTVKDSYIAAVFASKYAPLV